jgi:beta-lactamase superfamily II metal-dependent hydrolase
VVNIYRIELLPARHGDCILVEYGDAGHPARILIDGGPITAYPELQKRIEALPAEQREMELFVLTHIDADHIEGAIKLLNHPELACYQDIWFNGWPQLDQPLLEPQSTEDNDKRRSAIQGQFVGTRIGGRVWNGAFAGDPIFVPERGRLPQVALPGGMTLTLLAPRLGALKELKKAWDASLERLKIASNDEAEIARRLQKKAAYRGTRIEQRMLAIIQSAQDATGKLDAAVANGSSIAFIAEFAGKRCAFLGDAHMPAVEQGLKRFAREEGSSKVHLDAIKVAHHGSSANLTRAFLDLVDCNCYLVSTDGSIFGHPDDSALRMIVSHSPGAHLFFNYRSERNAVWGEEELQREFGYSATFPSKKEGGLVFDVLT